MTPDQLENNVLDAVVAEVMESMVFLGAEPSGAFDWAGARVCWSAIDLHSPVVGEMVIAADEGDVAELFDMLWAGEREADAPALRALMEELVNAISGQTQAQVDPSATAGLGLPTSGTGPLSVTGEAELRRSYTLDDGKVVGLIMRGPL